MKQINEHASEDVVKILVVKRVRMLMKYLMF